MKRSNQPKLGNSIQSTQTLISGSRSLTVHFKMFLYDGLIGIQWKYRDKTRNNPLSYILNYVIGNDQNTNWYNAYKHCAFVDTWANCSYFRHWQVYDNRKRQSSTSGGHSDFSMNTQSRRGATRCRRNLSWRFFAVVYILAVWPWNMPVTD